VVAGLGETIARIYDGVLSDDRWPAALDGFANSIGSAGVILVAADKVGLPFNILQATSNFGLERVRYYFETFGQYDEPAMSRAIVPAPPFTLVRDKDVWGDVSLIEDRPDYKFLRETEGIRRRGGVKLSTNKGWNDLLALQFAVDWDAVPPKCDQTLSLLAPHLAKAVELSRTFSLLRSSYSAVLAALDYLRVGICISSATGHVIALNKAAERTLALDDGLQLSREKRLICADPGETARLMSALRDVCATAGAEGSTQEALLPVTRKSGKRSFIVEFAPLRDVTGEIGTDFSGAAIFLINPDDSTAVSTERLCRLFDLTVAEAHVARSMVDGLSAGEIADLRGTAEETVRSQFKTVYAKTGVRRRADLVRLALSVDPLVDRGA